MKLNLNTNLATQLKTVLWIAFFWMIISILQLGYEYAVEAQHDEIPNWNWDREFLKFFLINTGTFFVIGLVGGAAIVFFLQRWFRTLPYGLAILYGVISFIVLFFVLTCFQMAFFASMSIKLEQVPREVLRSIRVYFFSIEFAKNFIFWMLVLIGTLLGLFVSDKYGPGGLKKFLLGQYFHPKQEERIFMFLDLKGSTSIAEKLGESQYFEFLKEVIKDATPAILNTRGEIYQYVGDEIVISWPLAMGIKNANCIRCFFEIQQALKQKNESFEKHFGVQPVFKAGLHCGKVIAGEIGVIKRDITFSGDVLNTTARIQGKCNELGVFILLSSVLISLFPPSSLAYSPKRVGVVPLRGKENAIELYTI